MKPAMTPQQAQYSAGERSAFALYRALATGKASMLHFLHYEAATFFCANVPGLLGLGLRALLYRPLFAACASRPGLGRSLSIRIPKQISLGRGVLVDDFAVLDVRGDNASIRLDDHVTIGRFTTVAAKGGHVDLKPGVNVGSYCRIATNSSVSIGESTLVAAYCYIGPGNHQRGDDDTPLIERPMDIKGGVTIGKHCWIGTRATILDGVTIGDGAIIGAHSLVKDDVPAGVTVVGVPAKPVGG